MRWNTKKVVGIFGAGVLLWFILAFTSYVDVPKMSKSRSSVVDIENRIERLQKQMDKQLFDSSALLNRVKSHLKRKNQEDVDFTDIKEEDNASVHDELAVTEKLIQEDARPILPVLVIACDRVTVKRCLDNLVKFRPNKETFPIIVSQDCGHNQTYRVIKSYVDADPSISVVQQPDLSEIPLPRSKVKFRGYYNIARHYKFALNHVLNTLGHEAVIIVEDDLDISPDFFEYFLGTYPLLHKDPTIWCISAWNDNGKKDLVEAARPELLYRTDFFPGLGWMMLQDTWQDLVAKWPPGFFDDWLRNPENTNNRVCVRPEISRTYSFGKVGVSKGLYFDLHLKHMQLNYDFVEFTKLNLTYLIKDNYDKNFISQVYSLPEITAEEVMSGGGGGGAARVPYASPKAFRRAAKTLGLMDDFRSGIPRAAYRGVVSCYVRGRRVHLAPALPFAGYDPNS